MKKLFLLIIACLCLFTNNSVAGSEEFGKQLKYIIQNELLDSVLSSNDISKKHASLINNISNFALQKKNEPMRLLLTHNLGKFYFYKKEYVKALPYLLNYNALNKNKSSDKIDRENSYYLGKLFFAVQIYKDALHYFKQVLSSEHVSLKMIAKVQFMLGESYLQSNQLDSAIVYLKNGLKDAQQIEDEQLASEIFSSLAKMFQYKGNYKNALLYIQSALVIHIADNKKEVIFKDYLNQAELLSLVNDHNAAIASYKNALKLKEKIDKNYLLGLSNYTSYLLELNKYIDIRLIIPLDILKNYSNSNEYAYLKQLYSSLSEAHLELGEYKQSSIASKLAMTYDKLFVEKERKSLSEKQNLQLAIIKVRNDFNLNQLRLQNTQSGFFSTSVNIVSLFILLIAISLFHLLLYRYKKSKREKISLQNKLKIINEQLNDYNKKLKREVEEKTITIKEELEKRKSIDVDLKKALKKAEDSNYVKNAFLSNMSHEIRTPLNGIIGFSELLLTELSIMENKELFDFANGIRESGDRLLNLLNNIIDISRIEANDMEVQLVPCSVNEIIKKTSELFKFKSNEKGIKFNVKYNDIPNVLGDQKSITRVITDIIENSVKYTDKGFINVITDFDIDSNKVLISIKDTGIGIDQTYLNHIFEAFRQESLGYSRNYQGAGLGLPLSKRLIDLMKGEIKVESSKGVGTTVKIWLNSDTNKEEIDQDVIEKVITPALDDESINKINIFIVEDDRMNRLVLSKMLAKVGNNSLAVDGEESLEIIGKAYKEGLIYDIMLFDINLPAPWDGIKLMNEVKEKWSEYKYIPFIAQTAYAMTGDRERLLEAGFDDYIPKPVNKNKLINSIYRQFEISKKQKK
jgi:signal transduction histidine kinase/CheY-like chemotaxis protein